MELATELFKTFANYDALMEANVMQKMIETFPDRGYPPFFKPHLHGRCVLRRENFIHYFCLDVLVEISQDQNSPTDNRVYASDVIIIDTRSGVLTLIYPTPTQPVGNQLRPPPFSNPRW
ncbi:unnamed protein product [Dibothriocephalus latus]|uniref:Uncharacterized protein n=1 Tax=Dibothriocephalus latus TaxID=60516 RepID=A0A3P7QNG8_DIBLA|nr:unnamed protein product [Dibothriocephalus latus]